MEKGSKALLAGFIAAGACALGTGNSPAQVNANAATISAGTVTHSISAMCDNPKGKHHLVAALQLWDGAEVVIKNSQGSPFDVEPLRPQAGAVNVFVLSKDSYEQATKCNASVRSGIIPIGDQNGDTNVLDLTAAAAGFVKYYRAFGATEKSPYVSDFTLHLGAFDFPLANISKIVVGNFVYSTGTRDDPNLRLAYDVYMAMQDTAALPDRPKGRQVPVESALLPTTFPN